MPDRGQYFLASYANYYLTNGAVILPRFDDRTTDQRAASLLACTRDAPSSS